MKQPPAFWMELSAEHFRQNLPRNLPLNLWWRTVPRVLVQEQFPPLQSCNFLKVSRAKNNEHPWAIRNFYIAVLFCCHTWRIIIRDCHDASKFKTSGSSGTSYLNELYCWESGGLVPTHNQPPLKHGASCGILHPQHTTIMQTPGIAWSSPILMFFSSPNFYPNAKPIGKKNRGIDVGHICETTPGSWGSKESKYMYTHPIHLVKFQYCNSPVEIREDQLQEYEIYEGRSLWPDWSPKIGVSLRPQWGTVGKQVELR